MVRHILLALLLSSVSMGIAQECNPGEIRSEECNSCICTDSGIWACTKVQCLAETKARSTDNCNEGEVTSLDDGCNTCICTNGLWACTQILCLRSAPQAVAAAKDATCVNGEVTSFDNGCNTCICGNGLWACTLKICLEGNE